MSIEAQLDALSTALPMDGHTLELDGQALSMLGKHASRDKHAGLFGAVLRFSIPAEQSVKRLS